MNGAQWDYLTESSKVANKVAGTLIWTVNCYDYCYCCWYHGILYVC